MNSDLLSAVDIEVIYRTLRSASRAMAAAWPADTYGAAMDDMWGGFQVITGYSALCNGTIQILN